MRIKVNQAKSDENEMEVFVKFFNTGRELALKAWGDK